MRAIVIGTASALSRVMAAPPGRLSRLACPAVLGIGTAAPSCDAGHAAADIRYSARSASTGFTDAARRAGMTLANTATAMKITAPPMNDSGSSGRTP